jgi:shikimate kinase
MVTMSTAMADRARVIVLVGPKGSGKTTIGSILGRQPGVHFLDVERIAKEVLASTGNQITEDYARRAFEAIVATVQSIEHAHRVVVLETTGASDATPTLLDGLRQRHDVRLVRIRAQAATCEARIATRDASRQIPVPHGMILEMHRRTEALSLPWDLEITNDPPLDEPAVLRAFQPLL